MSTQTLLVGTATYGLSRVDMGTDWRCVECGRPARIYHGHRCGPWCSQLCRDIGRCRYCGLPPSDAEGHWCRTPDGKETWRRWEQ